MKPELRVLNSTGASAQGLCNNRSDVPQTFAGREVVFPAACEYPTILRFDSGLCQFLYANQDVQLPPYHPVFPCEP